MNDKLMELRRLEALIINWEDRLCNIEGYCNALEMKFIDDVQKKPRVDEVFLEERLRALEQQVKFLLDKMEDVVCPRTTVTKIEIIS